MHGHVSTYQHLIFLANCRFAVRFAPWPNLPNPLVHYEDGLHIFGIPQKQHVSHVPHPPPTHKSLSSLGRRPNFSRSFPPPTPSSFPLSRLASSRDAKLSVARDRKTNVDFFRARGSPDGRYAGDWVEEARELRDSPSSPFSEMVCDGPWHTTRKRTASENAFLPPPRLRGCMAIISRFLCVLLLYAA